MKSFRFRLQAILTLREQKEQAAKRIYAEKLRAQEVVAHRLQAAEREIEALMNLQRGQMNSGITCEQLERFRNYLVVLDDRRKALQIDLVKAKQITELAWRELLVATQKREALDRLRSRQQRMYSYEAARAEQKLIDELSSRSDTLADAWRENPVALGA
jgi:flagellar export protein FliJ